MRTTNQEPRKYSPLLRGGAVMLLVAAAMPAACSLTPNTPTGAAGDSSSGNSTSTGATGNATGTGGSGTVTTGGTGTGSGGTGTLAVDDPSCQKDPFVPLDLLSTVDP